MPKFDKRFVHFMWSDELEGKEVLYSDIITFLVEFVTDGETDDLKIVSYSDDNTFPFRVDGDNWRFIYYDPHFKLKVAHEQGKVIQYHRINDCCDAWLDCDVEPDWNCPPERYRIKPEEPEQEKPVTNKELSKWLAQGNGEFYYYGDDGYESNVYTYHDYSMEEANYSCETIGLKVKVKKWEDADWHTCQLVITWD